MRKERKGHRLDGILIPATAGETNALSLLFFIWRCYAEKNASEASKLAVIITLGCDPNIELRATIEGLARIYEVDRFFNKVEVHFLGIPINEDIYIRHDQAYEQEIPPYGLKSGPNIQFFESAKLCSDANTILLNESDMYPVSPSWVRDIATVTRQSEPFWVLGSVYRGSQKLGPDISSHINGNAFYATGHESFMEYLKNVWAPGVKDMCQRLPDTAYDIWFSRHYHGSLNTRFDEISAAEYTLLTEAALQQRTTKTIANLSITTDKISVERLDELERDGCSLVHAKQALGPALAKSIKSAIEPERNSLSLAALTRAYIDIQHSKLPKPFKYTLAQAIAWICTGDHQRAAEALDHLQNEEVGEDSPIQTSSSQQERPPAYYAGSAISQIEDLKSPGKQDLESAIDSLYAFSPYRSGSTLLFNGLHLLCGEGFLRKDYISLCDASFSSTGDPHAWVAEPSSEKLLLAKDRIYGGFRDATAFTSEQPNGIRIRLFEEIEKAGVSAGFAFLLRDPRDCIASLYHLRFCNIKDSAINSEDYEPGDIKENSCISPDEFALKAMHEVGCNIGGILAVASEAKARGFPVCLFAYEDALFRQKEMFALACSLFGFNLSSSLWQSLVALSRDPRTKCSTYLGHQQIEHSQIAHVRRATPGEHKSLFSTESNEVLERYFAEILEAMACINPDYVYVH